MDVHLAEKHREQAVNDACRGPQRHQRVHIGAELHKAREAHRKVGAVQDQNRNQQCQLHGNKGVEAPHIGKEE